VASSLDALGIRKRLGRDLWASPDEFGPDGWTYVARAPYEGRVIVTAWDHDTVEWVHASMSHPDLMPTYDDLKRLHEAVWPDGFAYQMFVPSSEHVNIHEHALHLWGRLDGARVLPDFGFIGSI
jgi:hypothetical protein